MNLLYAFLRLTQIDEGKISFVFTRHSKKKKMIIFHFSSSTIFHRLLLLNWPHQIKSWDMLNCLSSLGVKKKIYSRFIFFYISLLFKTNKVTFIHVHFTSVGRCWNFTLISDKVSLEYISRYKSHFISRVCKFDIAVKFIF